MRKAFEDLMASADTNVCRPIRIASDDSASESRIGGFPPLGVRSLYADAQYFCTLPLSEEYVMSIFGRFASDEWFEAFGSLQVGSALLDVVLHQPTIRGRECEQMSDLEARRLQIGSVRPDLDDDGYFYPFHKIGGRASRLTDDALSGLLDRVESEGFMQFCQFEFPTPQDAAIGGSWPFGDALFHLWFRSFGGRVEWAWLAGHR
jgi:hypothetical protein